MRNTPGRVDCIRTAQRRTASVEMVFERHLEISPDKGAGNGFWGVSMRTLPVEEARRLKLTGLEKTGCTRLGSHVQQLLDVSVKNKWLIQGDW